MGPLCVAAYLFVIRAEAFRARSYLRLLLQLLPMVALMIR
jgi:hypothetical protein